MKDMRIHFDKYNLFEVALVGFIIFALWRIRSFLLVLGVGLIVSTFIEDFVVLGERYKIPRVASVVLFYVVTLLVFSGIIIFLVPVISTEVGSLSEIYPEIKSIVGLDTVLASGTDGFSGQDLLNILRDESIREQFSKQALAIFGGVFNLVVIFIVSFYLSIQKNSIDHMLRIFTPLKYEEIVISIWHRVQKKVGSWFRGQLLIAAIVVVLTYIFLSLLGIPYALLLSALAGLFGLVPYGIFIAILPVLGIALVHGGVWDMLWVLAFYFGLQQLLDLVLQPLIFKKLTGIPSLVVILAVTVGARLFGIYGLFLAIPIALFVMEIITESEKQKSSLREPLVPVNQEPEVCVKNEDNDIVIVINK
jgi:predicted PurR-regulated permease PerM